MGASGAEPAMVSGRPETLPGPAPAARLGADGFAAGLAGPPSPRPTRCRRSPISGYGPGEAAAAVPGGDGRAELDTASLIRAALRVLAPKG